MDNTLLRVIVIICIAIIASGLIYYYRVRHSARRKEEVPTSYRNAAESEIDRAKGEAYLDIRRTSQGSYGTRRI